MAECETETVQVNYYADAEFDDASGVFPFGPFSNRTAVENVTVALAGRTDCKKVTIRKEAVV